LTILYPILVYQLQLCEIRSALIDDSVENYNKYLTQAENSLFCSDSIIKVQATQLDIVSKLCMFIEDYLSFSHYLHTCKKQLPIKIQSQNNVIWDEINYLNDLKKQEIQDYLLLRNVNEFFISDKDKNFVSRFGK
jgi:hypothetical protein